MNPRPHLLSRKLTIHPFISTRLESFLTVRHVLLFPNALADLPEPECHNAGDAEEH
jgi:hypothetical protein